MRKTGLVVGLLALSMAYFCGCASISDTLDKQGGELPVSYELEANELAKLESMYNAVDWSANELYVFSPTNQLCNVGWMTFVDEGYYTIVSNAVDCFGNDEYDGPDFFERQRINKANYILQVRDDKTVYKVSDEKYDTLSLDKVKTLISECEEEFLDCAYSTVLYKKLQDSNFAFDRLGYHKPDVDEREKSLTLQYYLDGDSTKSILFLDGSVYYCCFEDNHMVSAEVLYDDAEYDAKLTKKRQNDTYFKYLPENAKEPLSDDNKKALDEFTADMKENAPLNQVFEVIRYPYKEQALLGRVEPKDKNIDVDELLKRISDISSANSGYYDYYKAIRQINELLDELQPYPDVVGIWPEDGVYFKEYWLDADGHDVVQIRSDNQIKRLHFNKYKDKDFWPSIIDRDTEELYYYSNEGRYRTEVYELVK